MLLCLLVQVRSGGAAAPGLLHAGVIDEKQMLGRIGLPEVKCHQSTRTERQFVVFTLECWSTIPLYAISSRLLMRRTSFIHNICHIWSSTPDSCELTVPVLNVVGATCPYHLSRNYCVECWNSIVSMCMSWYVWYVSRTWWRCRYKYW